MPAESTVEIISIFRMNRRKTKNNNENKAFFPNIRLKHPEDHSKRRKTRTALLAQQIMITL